MNLNIFRRTESMWLPKAKKLVFQGFSSTPTHRSSFSAMLTLVVFIIVNAGEVPIYDVRIFGLRGQKR